MATVEETPRAAADELAVENPATGETIRTVPIASAPRTTLCSLISSSNVYPGPPVPVPSGQPPWIMKSLMMRWNVSPS